jgi:hypothetical protein
MREPWSMPIPQAMQQHGGVSNDDAKSPEFQVRARKTRAAPTPADIDCTKEPVNAVPEIGQVNLGQI